MRSSHHSAARTITLPEQSRPVGDIDDRHSPPLHGAAEGIQRVCHVRQALIGLGVANDPRLGADQVTSHDRVRALGEPLGEAPSELIERRDDRIGIAEDGEGLTDLTQPSGVLVERLCIDSLQQPYDGADLFDALACLMNRGSWMVSQVFTGALQLLPYDMFQPATN